MITTQRTSPPEYLPSPEEIEAIIEEARRRARRRRRRNSGAAAALTLVGLAVVFGGGLGGAAQTHSEAQPAAQRPVVTPVRLTMHNGPIGIFGYPGGVRDLSGSGQVDGVVVHCGDCRMVRGADWSANGRLLVYNVSCAFGGCACIGGCNDPEHGIRVLDLTTGIDRRIVSGDLNGPLSVTADGTRVAYDHQHSIRTVPTDGSRPPTTILTMPHGLFLHRPTWSPDGRWIAYTLGHKVYTMAADGSNRRFLVDGTIAAWSPDGRWIAYVRDGDIRLISPGGGDDHLLASGATTWCDSCNQDYLAADLSWSPNGHELAVMIGRRIVIVSPQTGSVRRLRVSAALGSMWLTKGLIWRPAARSEHTRAFS
jgi:Tol biopolymer transport system component